MNPENNLEPVLFLMQNVVDQLAQNELTLTKGFKEILDASIQPKSEQENQLLEKLIVDQTELLNLSKSIQDSTELILHKHDTFLNAFIDFSKIIQDKVEHSKPEQINTVHNKKIIIFGDDATISLRYFITTLTIALVLIFGLKLFFDYQNDQSQFKLERDIYFKTYRYVALTALDLNDSTLVRFIDNSLTGFKKNDSILESRYKALEDTYQKEMKKQTLKKELNELNNDSEN